MLLNGNLPLPWNITFKPRNTNISPPRYYSIHKLATTNNNNKLIIIKNIPHYFIINPDNAHILSIVGLQYEKHLQFFMSLHKKVKSKKKTARNWIVKIKTKTSKFNTRLARLTSPGSRKFCLRFFGCQPLSCQLGHGPCYFGAMVQF